MENCASMEPWAFLPAFPETCWMAEAFARDNEALTRALQISLSDDSSASASASASATVSAAAVPSPDSLSASTSSLFHQFVKPELAVSGSALYSPPNRARNTGPCSLSGKITKRKSRASKRSPTTYITADPANFRQMVQQVTGIRLAGAETGPDPVLKPEPQRPGAGRPALLQQSCLPTLDTSAFLLDRSTSTAVSGGAAAPSGNGSWAAEGSAFEFEPFPSFPTLESWTLGA